MEQFFHGQLFSSEELQELDSIVWPYEDFFSSNSFLISDPGCKNSCLIDPKESFEPLVSSIFDERLADSFFQIDPRAQFEGSICPNEEDSNKCTEAEQSMQSKRKFRADECSNDVAVPAASCSKKVRGSLSPLPVVEKTLENLQQNMNQKICDVFYEEEENEISSSPKDDGSTVYREFNGGENEISSKLEASDRRGATAESQSLYARKRREKISERLKILQNLVPNGTKVDTSTMLEEAVQYVKFLQLQIKILSSDELWMYAPLAYNGVSIGLDLMIPSSYLS